MKFVLFTSLWTTELSLKRTLRSVASLCSMVALKLNDKYAFSVQSLHILSGSPSFCEIYWSVEGWWSLDSQFKPTDIVFQLTWTFPVNWTKIWFKVNISASCCEFKKISCISSSVSSKHVRHIFPMLKSRFMSDISSISTAIYRLLKQTQLNIEILLQNKTRIVKAPKILWVRSVERQKNHRKISARSFS